MSQMYNRKVWYVAVQRSDGKRTVLIGPLLHENAVWKAKAARNLYAWNGCHVTVQIIRDITGDGKVIDVFDFAKV